MSEKVKPSSSSYGTFMNCRRCTSRHLLPSANDFHCHRTACRLTNTRNCLTPLSIVGSAKYLASLFSSINTRRPYMWKTGLPHASYNVCLVSLKCSESEPNYFLVLLNLKIHALYPFGVCVKLHLISCIPELHALSMLFESTAHIRNVGSHG